MNSYIIPTLTAIAGLLCGSGGVFAYLSTRRSQQHTENLSTVDEWKSLYVDMKDRYTQQEQLNAKIREEVDSLKQQVIRLTTELEGYKQFDKYIADVESFTDILLVNCESLMTPEAYERVCSRRPLRPTSLHISD